MSRSKLLMLGDSLVDFGNWRSRLPDYAIVSQGVPGEMAEGLLWRIPYCSSHQSVDAILVMTGTNNIFTGDTDFTHTIAEIVTSLRHNYPSAIIILNSLVPFQFPEFQETIQAINNELQDVARITGVHYFDLYTPFSQARSTLYEFDGVHFNDRGYRLWARLLSNELRTLLAKELD